MLNGDKDFLLMGLGIERRAKAYHDYWIDHFRKSREFITQALPQTFLDVAVLGAGRIFDIDIDALAERCRCIRLADLDRGCKIAWQGAADEHPETHVLFHFLDLTGVLRRWTSFLRRCGSPQALENLLDRLSAEPIPDAPIPPSEVIVSLNLLSQIPIYWRDRVEGFAAMRGWDQIDWREKLGTTMEILQLQHLRGLQESSASTVVIITDVDFGPDAPRALTPRADFRQIPGFALKCTAAWTWTVVPPAPDDPDGEVHSVEAVALDRAICSEGMLRSPA